MRSPDSRRHARVPVCQGAVRFALLRWTLPRSSSISAIDGAKPILVYLAAGVQGGAVVREGLRRGLRVRALVRNKARTPSLAPLGVEIAEGDLGDLASLQAPSDGVDHAILQIPIGPTHEMRKAAYNATAALAAGGCRSVILKLASASRPAPSESSFEANAMVEDIVRRSGLPFAIVRPTMYLDNLLKPSARRDIVQDGVFAVPLAAYQRIAWTSADDCAAAALTLLEREAYGGDHLIAGPESVDGDGLVTRISAALGRQVVYRAQALEIFEREVDAAMGSGAGARVGAKFRFFATNPQEANAMLAGSFEPKSGLEGFRPSTIEQWARDNKEAFEAADHPD